MATAPKTHQRRGFANLGCFLPKSNSYKNIVLIISTAKIPLLTPKAEMSLVGRWSCRVPHTAQTLQGQTYGSCTWLQRVFPSDDGVFGLCCHS